MRSEQETSAADAIVQRDMCTAKVSEIEQRHVERMDSLEASHVEGTTEMEQRLHESRQAHAKVVGAHAATLEELTSDHMTAKDHALAELRESLTSEHPRTIDKVTSDHMTAKEQALAELRDSLTVETPPLWMSQKHYE